MKLTEEVTSHTAYRSFTIRTQTFDLAFIVCQSLCAQPANKHSQIRILVINNRCGSNQCDWRYSYPQNIRPIGNTTPSFLHPYSVGYLALNIPMDFVNIISITAIPLRSISILPSGTFLLTFQSFDHSALISSYFSIICSLHTCTNEACTSSRTQRGRKNSRGGNEVEWFNVVTIFSCEKNAIFSTFSCAWFAILDLPWKQRFTTDHTVGHLTSLRNAVTRKRRNEVTRLRNSYHE